MLCLVLEGSAGGEFEVTLELRCRDANVEVNNLDEVGVPSIGPETDRVVDATEALLDDRL